MSFGEAVKSVFSQYVGFSGRARRSEYWWFFLFYVIVLVALAIVDNVIGTYPLLYAIGGLAMFLPSLAVLVRRLHDTGRSGWWVLIGLIPLVGPIILLVFACMDSAPDNQHGPNPKSAGAGYHAPGVA